MGSVELLSRRGEIANASAGLDALGMTLQAIIIWGDELMNA